MSLLLDVWGVLTPRQRRWVAWTQVLSIVMAFSTIAGIASIAPFFSLLGNPRLIEQSGPVHWLYVFSGFSSRRSFEVALGVAFVSLVLAANLINVVGSFVMIRVARWIGTDLQCTLFGEYLARPYIFHAATNSALLFNNIMHETNRLTNEILLNVFLLVTNAVTAAFIVIMVMLVNPTAALAMVAALLGGYALIYLAVRKRLFHVGEVQTHFYTELAKSIGESLGAIKEILVLGAQDVLRSGFARSSQAFGRAAAHTQIIAQSPRHLMECVAVAGLVVAALIVGSRGEGIGPRLGQLTFLGFAAYRLLPTLQQAFGAIVRIRAGRAGFAAIAPDLRAARRRVPYAAAADESWRQRPRRDIRLTDVSFRYAEDGPPAISDASLCIPARAAVGLVGSNGSGKTTLVDLIAGLLVPATGRLEVDGIPLDDGNRPLWQSAIAYVPQQIFLLDTSIAQNIALGVPGGKIEPARLAAAARLAQLDEFIASLPDGFDHLVGERGMRLSGGQRQRIGIARALYREASVLILDEATSALDGLTEQELLATILRLRGRYTIILIAHRLSTVRACDLIVEVERGKIAGIGTFDALLRRSESFRQLTTALKEPV
jgi:HlyD family secretion protein